MKHYKSLVN